MLCAWAEQSFEFRERFTEALLVGERPREGVSLLR
jgi:hypothetical protein